MALASFICGLVAFFGCCNPMYLVSLASIILGIIALCAKKEPKWMAIVGLITGGISIVVWPIIEIAASLLTMGMYLPLIFI